jgi:DNA-binding response OmpR family regulator
VSVVILRARGGHIAVPSNESNEHWAAFVVDAAVRHASTRASRKLVSLKGYIAIVEPDDLIRELLERWLSEAGYGVVLSAKDHHLDMLKPQLVIADISSPDSAGTTIEALRAAYSAPILALSARFRRGLGGSSEAAHRLHVGKVLPKPFTREELLAAVGEAIENR